MKPNAGDMPLWDCRYKLVGVVLMAAAPAFLLLLADPGPVKFATLFATLSLSLGGTWFVGSGLDARVQQKLLEHSLVDPATQLSNRRGFLLHAEQAVKLAARNKKGFWLALFDVDGLKAINAKKGIAAGDRAIRDAADILRAAFRMSDVRARLGGNEFAAISLEASRDSFAILEKRYRQAVTLHNVDPSTPNPVYFSAGWAYFDPAGPVTVDELLTEAGKSLQKEKSARKY